MMEKKFYKVTFIVSCIILILSGIIFIRGTRYAEVFCNYEPIAVSDCLVSIKGYNTNEIVNFTVAEEDPQLLFDFTKLGVIDKKVKGILIEFNDKINKSSVQTYYGRESAEFSEADSDVFAGKEDYEIEILSNKSLQGFNFLRLDINEDFSLKDIKITYEYQMKYNDDTYKYICMILINIIISIVISFFQKIDIIRGHYCNKCKDIMIIICKNKNYILKVLLGTISIFCLVISGEYILSLENGYINIYRVLIITTIMCIVIFSIIYRNLIWKYTHIYYFALVMTIGTITILTIPSTVGITADDQIHYAKTADLSYGGKGKVSETDAYVAMAVYTNFIQNGEMYNHISRYEWNDYINNNHKEYPILVSIFEAIPGGARLSITSVAYIPGAIGLIVGRGLGLCFTTTFMLGKWMNLLAYSLIFSIAIKIIKGRGKILISVMGVIPTILFSAASYSYDWWVISFVLLGYTIFINLLNQDGKIQTKRMLLIMTIMIIGILPKAIYFPLIFPMIFVKKDKCVSPYMIRALVICSMMFLVSTILLPMLTATGGVGDVRGGTDVNSTEQIKFIINNPLQYTKVLLNFLKTYLSPDEAYHYLTFLLYYGQAPYYSICLLVIAIVSMLDNENAENLRKILLYHKIIVVFSCAITIVFVATALYITFTSVGSDGIAGCHPRYILPTIFPFVYFSTNMKIQIDKGIKRDLYIVSTNIMIMVYFWGIFSLRVSSF